jgi:hypothetical protein
LIAPPRYLRAITLTAALSLMLVCAIPAAANPVTYTYTGDPFNSFTDGHSAFPAGAFMSASITLASPLAPDGTYSLVEGGVAVTNPANCGSDPCDGVVSWSIGDPTDTLSSAQGNTLYDLDFTTDAEGNILGWEIDAFANADDSQPELHSSGNLGPGEPSGQDYDMSTFLYDDLCCQAAYVTTVDAIPGIWSEEESASVPEPGTLTLLFGGLAAGALKRKGRGQVGGSAVRSRI